ncbi:MAG: hypothetical protein UT00_C0006G0052 [Parcubacteria group bacterium GW2011_GWA1_38_7]|nr:MAG: hypothetical protein UT00_C0006G0052 [Parcubacteria group bacterium GW2011_GWA1_38_7]
MKGIVTSVIVALVLIGGAFILTKSRGSFEPVINANNVSIENGVQIIEIKAKGGYLPRTSTAKAGIPTILRFDTNSTFDCSSSVRIPSMDISQSLPLSGTTDIDIGIQKVATLQGTCSMGMYPFEIIFQS